MRRSTSAYLRFTVVALLTTVGCGGLLDRAAAQAPPGAPTITLVSAAPGSLVVSWSDPLDAAEVPIGFYEIRHIRSDADDKSDPHWTTESGLPASGVLEYTIPSLGEGGGFDVQVRAVNANGEGAWSATVSGEPGEPGATRSEAAPLRLNTSLNATISTREDVDYYSLVLEESTDIWVWTTGRVDTAARIEDATGLEIANSTNRDIFHDLNFSIRRTLSAGTYFVRVRAQWITDRTTGDYQLHAVAVADPGDSVEAATQISLHRHVAGAAGRGSPDDFFSFAVNKDTWVRFRALHSHRAVDLNLTLRDIAGQIVPSYHEGFDYYRLTSQSYVAFEAHAFLIPGTYTAQISEASPGSGGPYEMRIYILNEPQKIHDRCIQLPMLLDEPLSGCQWHLKNTGQVRSGGAEQDINVEDAWNVTKGEGITVVIIDGGFQADHRDLQENVLSELNYSHSGSFFDPARDHGTTMAGLIAARDNGFGMLGVAPRASIYGSNTVRQFGDDDAENRRIAAQAAVLHLEQTAVSNNSWGFGHDHRVHLLGDAWNQALERGIGEGYGGKGISYVFAAGNEGDYHWVGLREINSHYGVIVACAVDYRDQRSPFSVRGPGLWVCAPSDNDEDELPGLGATNKGSFNTTSGGTSSAAALVSGVAALVRSANTDLTWRDVKLILAGSARKNDPSSSTWRQAGFVYGSTSRRYNYSESFGFGAVDAGSAVSMAQSWTNLPPMRSVSDSIDGLSDTIDDNTINKTFTIPADYVDFVEYVTLHLDITHERLRELKISLRSPLNNESNLIYTTGPPGLRDDYDHSINAPIFIGSAGHLGEDPAGTWTLTIRDQTPFADGELKGLRLVIRGHGYKPAAPEISSLEVGNTYLTIAWEPPEDTGTSAISSYDVRYIRSDASDKADEHWTMLSGVWSSGAPRYTLDGLTLDVGYDVQMRAVNTSGTGAWSEPESQRTALAAPQAPRIDSVSAADRSLTLTWSAPAGDGGAEIASYDVRYIDSGETDRADANWSLAVAWASGDGDLTYSISSVQNETAYDLELRAVNSVGAGPWSATATIRRNQPPRFADPGRSPYLVSEHARSGRAVGSPLVAIDQENDPLTYSIADPSTPFAIDADSGQLRTLAPLDYESAPSYTVTVQVTDRRDSLGRANNDTDDTIAVRIGIMDENDRPVARDDVFSTSEDAPARFNVLSNDSDPDAGDSLSLRIVSTPRGEVLIEPGNLIHYRPARDDHGEDSFRYETTDTSGLSDTAVVNIEIEPVNDPPAFPAARTIRTIAPGATPGAPLGAPVRAADVDGDQILYSLFGSADFEIDERSGQIRVASGAVVEPAEGPTYTLFVTARDPHGEQDHATVDVLVGDFPSSADSSSAGGGATGASGAGGGGGGAPPVAAPSEADFDWNVTRDIESLAREHDEPTGMWSDGETLRLLHNAASGADRLFAYDLATGERVERMEFELDRRNRFAHGIWSDGETAWVSDSGQDRLFAYILASGERVEDREFDLAERNRDPRGIWSDGQTLVVLDAVKDALFGYDPASGELAFEHALDPLNRSPRGIWSDGLGIWVSDDGANRVFAYRLEENGLRRVEAEEFGFRVLLKAGSGEARGIWSDGDTLWLADAEDAEIYSFNLPDAIQAQLASLALSDLELDLSPQRLSYSLELPPDLDETTVDATAAQEVAAVSIEPDDADADPDNGHQIALDGIKALTVTVTSQDGSRSREYRVTFERAACFDGQSEDVDELLRTVEFAGGSLEELEACALEHGLSALYHFDGDSWRGLFFNAPDFLSRPFREFFAGGVPPGTSLTGRSS